MTTLYTVSVDAVEDRTLRGRVHLVNSDAPLVPRAAVFPLALLADLWWNLDRGYLHDEAEEDEYGGDRCPFDRERGQAIASAMRLGAEYARIFDLILGKTVRVTEDGYLLADDGRTVLEPKRRAADVYELSSGRGRDGVSHFVMTPGDEAGFARAAAAIVTGYEIGPYRNVPLLSEVAALDGQPFDGVDGPADLDDYEVWRAMDDRSFADQPYAEISVTVADAGYLEHVAAGMRWSTTMTGHVC
ncbi:hypothetical protein [Glycomyces sp. NPDC048151]|uniref:hypothetical protein n=1 Tax=Glycomyces sp. NPDC048151 TaxID=3364002 RepID=UPI0037187D56